MGLYDTIRLFATCPYCGSTGFFLGQTKDLEGGHMRLFTSLSWDTRKPLFEKDAIVVLDGYVSRMDLHKDSVCQYKVDGVNLSIQCHSSLCEWWADRRDIVSQGTPSGFGRMWYCEVPVELIDGTQYFIGKPQNIKLDDLTEEKLEGWEGRLDTGDRELYEKALERLKYPPFALRYMYKFGR